MASSGSDAGLRRADTIDNPSLGDSNISPWMVGRYHGWYEISRGVVGVDGFGREGMLPALAGGEEI
jgi:hypothetical protein